MSPPPSSSFEWITSIPIPILSAIVGGGLVLAFFVDYFHRRRAEVATLATATPDLTKVADPISRKPRPTQAKRIHQKSHALDKEEGKHHHHLYVNTLKGHSDAVTGMSFSANGLNLATACADGIVRVFKLDDDVSSRSFKTLKINLPAGVNPTAVTFSEGASSVVVAGQKFYGSSLYMYGNVAKPVGDGKQQGKSSLPEIMWEHDKVHDMKVIRTLVGAVATYGSADGSTIIASCSEGTDIKLWHGKSGKNLGTVDTNQLKNTMAAISPNGRFLAAAAFTADVKVWEIIYSKDGSVKEVLRVMQLKGHKSAVTWLCFNPNSEQIITSSKDGSIRIWNINVRYHLDEDPKTLKVFPIPLLDVNGGALYYDHISLSPDGRILAATHGSTLQWLCTETGKVLDMADKSHEGALSICNSSLLDAGSCLLSALHYAVRCFFIVLTQSTFLTDTCTYLSEFKIIDYPFSSDISSILS